MQSEKVPVLEKWPKFPSLWGCNSVNGLSYHIMCYDSPLTVHCISLTKKKRNHFKSAFFSMVPLFFPSFDSYAIHVRILSINLFHEKRTI